MKPTTKDFAEYFGLALEAGVCHEEEIEAWADKMIIETASPIPKWLLDLSMEEEPGKNRLLDAVPGEADKLVVWHLVLARLGIAYRTKQLSREKAFKTMYRWVAACKIPEPFSKQVQRLDDGLDGVKQGWYEEKQVIKDFEGFFDKFRAFELLLPGPVS